MKTNEALTDCLAYESFIGLRELFQDSGLAGVQVRAIEVPAVFRDFEDYWSPFLSGRGHAPDYIRSLSAGQRALLEERLRAAMPVRADGAIHLVNRAWALRGTTG